MVLLLLLLVLAAAVFATFPLHRALGRAAGWPLALVLLASTGLVLAQAPQVLGAGTPIEFAKPWMPEIGVELRLRMDGVGWLFTLLVNGVGALILAYSARYFPPGPRLGFYALMTFFALAMTGLVMADDVVLLFVFWELTTVASFLLIGTSGRSGNAPAIRALLTTVVGGLALMTAAILMALRTGTTRLSTILADPVWAEDPAFSSTVAVLVILAAFTKSAQFPFHYWLPDAMAANTPVSAYLHAAAMVKAGIFLLMRFTPAFAELPLWNYTLIAFGLVTAVVGAVFAFQQYDLKKLAAYSTVSQLGLLVAVIGVGTEAALVAAAVHTLAHALFKAALFMVVGLVDHQAGSRDLREIRRLGIAGGLRRRMPVTATVAALAGLSMAGVPPLLGFVSKENVFKGLLEAPGPAWVGPAAGTVAVIASVFTFAYTYRFVHGAFWSSSPRPDRSGTSVSEAGYGFAGPPAVAAVLGLVLGLAVPVLNPMAERAAAEATGEAEAEAGLALWHGLSADLFMSLAAIALGALLVWWTASGERLAGRRLFPVDGVIVFEALREGIMALGRRVGDLTRSDAPPRHLVVPIVLVIALAGIITATGLEVPEPYGETSSPLDWLLIALITASVIGAVYVRSRTAGLVLVGSAGLTTALWLFLLGAFDVAFAQMVVEILTVVIAALILRRLPARFHRISLRRYLATGAIALFAGLSAALGVFYLTGRRGRSEASQYFLENSEEDTGGTNVVNTILVDYRALDTLGELVVLGVAGLIVIAVLNSSGLLTAHGDRRLVVSRSSAVYDADDNTLVMRAVSYLLLPLIVFWSLWLFLRGHTDVGGGFVAGLLGGAAFALLYLAAPSASVAKIRLAYPRIIGAGVAISLASGLFGYLDGSFLRPLHGYVTLPLVGEYHLTAALVFDAGVYLAVVGVILTALNQLGLEESLPGDSTAGTVRPVRDQPPTDDPGTPPEVDAQSPLRETPDKEGGAR
ncbi:DUF4040 family protein [Nocardiopsis metallicus]|uniref:Multicomponent Na+:H+ antiporter subunit A n=1 Tax=Nocardiopsis metallicus TaxID=179819 RepID=A0A840WRK6_9ACTN|nr:DUF4040 family protein [Nocardiopsis metallicus]MBB5494286.1 multicomponent Na+:H+ antiporter subunit A [Nocardiopsis metallicus]